MRILGPLRRQPEESGDSPAALPTPETKCGDPLPTAGNETRRPPSGRRENTHSDDYLRTQRT